MKTLLSHQIDTFRSTLFDQEEIAEFVNEFREESQQIKPSDMLPMAILCPMSNLSTMFRYVVCRREGLEEGLEEMWIEAAFQYMPDKRNYDAVWGELLPVDARKELTQAYMLTCRRLFGRAAEGNVDVP